ncbi:MAG: hypothetical protein JXA18_13275 [Chitinispirillaceae bacterium]|nr:hypothetical protein [Chitinispirillaceae bacterium]
MRLFTRVVIIHIGSLISGAVADESPGKNNGGFSYRLSNAIGLFDSAYDVWDENRFNVVDLVFQGIASAYPENHLPRYWQGVVQFHLVSYTLFGLPEHHDKKAANKHVEKALSALEAALGLQPEDRMAKMGLRELEKHENNR